MRIRQGFTLATSGPSLRNTRAVLTRRGLRSNSLTVATTGTHARMRIAVAHQIHRDRKTSIIRKREAVPPRNNCVTAMRRRGFVLFIVVSAMFAADDEYVFR